jgi:sugar lactone lactonase YvrE
VFNVFCSGRVLLPVCAALLSGCASPPRETATEYDWRTRIGKPGGLGNVDGAGEAARFCQPCGVTFDAAGNAYVADYYNYTIRRVAPDGAVTTLAGCVGEPGGNDGTGSSARFDRPLGLASDAAGNLYVADSGNHTLRKVTPEGAVTTLAGSAGNAGSADGLGRDARFRSPHDVAADSAGNLYVADAYNHTIRKVTPAGAVTTLAGQAELKGGVPAGGFADGKGAGARFRTPRGVAVDPAGNVLVADTENAVLRRIAPDGTVKTLAGSAGNLGYANGTNSAARFSNPQGVTVDAAGNIFVADTGNQVLRKVTAAGLVSTVTNGLARFASPRDVAADKAGNLAVVDNDSQTLSRLAAKGGLTVLAGSASGHGSADGPAAAARFSRPCGLVADPQRNLFVADNFNHTLRKVTPDGVVTTLAGKAWSTGSADGPGDAARFFWPSGMTSDREGNLYVADAGNHTVRKVTPQGAVTTLAGGAGTNGWADGTGGRARFAWPSDVALDGAGNLLVADRANHVIRRVTQAGEVTTLAGGAGKAGRADGVGGAARFNNPSGVAVDAAGNVLVADTGNHTIRKVMPGGEVATLAGCAGIRGGADGQGVLARFNGPSDVLADQAGSVFVADRDNHMIRKVTPDGTVTTLGGSPNLMTAADGVGCAARFAQPSGLALDSEGVLYVADACNNRVAQGTPVAVCRTVLAPAAGKGRAEAKPEEGRAAAYEWAVFVGQPGAPGLDDGKGLQARLSGPQGLALDRQGTLYVADGRDGAIRKITPDGVVATLGGASNLFAGPVGIAVDGAAACYVTDGAHVLWKRSPSGDVKALAGRAKQRGAADGVGDAARFNFIPGVAVDAAGNAYLADHNNHTVRKVTPDGRVTTFAGRAGEDGTVDGVGGAARLTRPLAVAADREGNLYLAAGNTVRKVTPQGAVTTLAAAASFGRLDGLAVDRAGNVYAADRERHVIWKVTPQGAVAKLGGSELAMGGSGWLVTGLAVDRAGNVYVADSVRNCILKGKPQ